MTCIEALRKGLTSRDQNTCSGWSDEGNMRSETEVCLDV